eukprot:scaffold27721_cov112-Isochrysis_galbana.AAC.1
MRSGVTASATRAAAPRPSRDASLASHISNLVAPGARALAEERHRAAHTRRISRIGGAAPRVEKSRPARPAQPLAPSTARKVASDGLDVHGELPDRLASVQQENSAEVTRNRTHSSSRLNHRASRVHHPAQSLDVSDTRRQVGKHGQGGAGARALLQQSHRITRVLRLEGHNGVRRPQLERVEGLGPRNLSAFLQRHLRDVAVEQGADGRARVAAGAACRRSRVVPAHGTLELQMVRLCLMAGPVSRRSAGGVQVKPTTGVDTMPPIAEFLRCGKLSISRKSRAGWRHHRQKSRPGPQGDPIRPRRRSH